MRETFMNIQASTRLMNLTKRNILALAGVISSVLGIVNAVPSYLKENYTWAIGSTLLLVGGLVLLAIAWGD